MLINLNILYIGFSNNVYGEVNSNLVTEFIKNSELKPHHIFIDMGSGEYLFDLCIFIF